jgi:hypothetical protein
LNPKWNIDYATVFLVNRLGGGPHGSKDLVTAIGKIREKAHRSSRWNIPFQTFDSLNDILFAGRLKDAIYLQFADLGPYLSGTTCNPGEGLDSRVSRISIFLNSMLHKDAHPDEILASLIHQMIHAYFIVTCGPQLPDETKYGRLSHGMHFGKIMFTIKELSAVAGRQPLPIDFGHNLSMDREGQFHSFPAALFPLPPMLPRLRMVPLKFRGQKVPGRSCCPPQPNARGLIETEVDKWYLKTCSPLQSLPKCVRGPNLYRLTIPNDDFLEFPRTKAPLSSEFIELIFDEKCIYIPNSAIETYMSLKPHFEKSRWLEMPLDTSLAAFKPLYEFLLRGSFPPDTLLDLHNDPFTPILPPLIRGTDLAAPPYLTTSVRVFKLASALKFKELETYALSRLTSQSTTREDPLAVFSEIYNDSPDPHPDLRNWARAFLTRRERDERSGMAYLDLAIGAVTSVANLELLERDPSLRPRLEHLLEHGGAFHADVAAARTTLEHEREKEQGPFGWHRGAFNLFDFERPGTGIPIPPFDFPSPPPPRPPMLSRAMDDWDLPLPPPQMPPQFPSPCFNAIDEGVPLSPGRDYEREREAGLAAMGWGTAEKKDGFWCRRNRVTGELACWREREGMGMEWAVLGKRGSWEGLG